MVFLVSYNGLYLTGNNPLCPTLILNSLWVDRFRHLDGYVHNPTPKTYLLVLQLDANLGMSSAPFDDEIAHYLMFATSVNADG